MDCLLIVQCFRCRCRSLIYLFIAPDAAPSNVIVFAIVLLSLRSGSVVVSSSISSSVVSSISISRNSSTANQTF